MNLLPLATNGIIALCYFAIPFFMYRFIKKRQDIPFSNIWLLFAAFIASCGIGHGMHALAVFWHGLHHAAEYWHIVTMLVSAATVFKLPAVLRVAMSIPSPAQLQEINQQLADELLKNQN